MDYAKTIQPIFATFGEKMADGPQKKLLDFGGNRDHVALGLGLQLGGHTRQSASEDMYYSVILKSNRTQNGNILSPANQVHLENGH